MASVWFTLIHLALDAGLADAQTESTDAPPFAAATAPAAEGPSTEEGPSAAPPAVEATQAPPTVAAGTTMDASRLERLEQRMDSLEAENRDLRDSNAELRKKNKKLQKADKQLREDLDVLAEDLEYNDQRLTRLMPLSSRLTGYVDIGFFYVSGDGSGIRTDYGHNYFPEYEGVAPDSWVFMGDPMSVAINSRGEPPETSESRAVTFDPVGNNGKASFIANSLNLEYFGSVGDRFTVHGMIDFMPRNRDVSDPGGINLGDYIDVKHAYMQWAAPTKRFKLDLSLGKFDPVVGFEYRIQEAPDRITVTPSLLCRYVCGRTTGLKVRSRFLEDSITLNLAITNGSAFFEGFGFSNDVDTNHMKTFSGRLSYKLPVKGDVEFGISGLVGAQDLQAMDDTIHWQAGGDVHVQWAGLDFTAEYVQGKLEGETETGQPLCNLEACLEFKSMYGLLGYRFTNWIMPYARVDWRDALHVQGGSFVYVSKLVRATGGIRFDVGEHVILKGEYTYNHELGDIPQFRNDTFTTSAIARF